MFWLTKLVDDILAAQPEGDIIVSSGVSPSGTYHVGTLREVMSAEAIAREVRRRGRVGRHIHVVDDLDVFRKIPINISDDFKQYLGKPLCDVPAPDSSGQSYADYFLNDLLSAAEPLNFKMEVVRSHQKYRSGFFSEAIEKSLGNISVIREILEKISGHKLSDKWAPVQIIEDGYLKNRQFVSIDKQNKNINYLDADGVEQTKRYANGDVKLNWRIDWPARWYLLGVGVEPFGRDHATKGGSYDTGAEIVTKVFGAKPPLPVPYNFINRTGDTKKMSKSAGNVVTAAELVKILPPEAVWFFMLRYPPEKQLFFDEGNTLTRLVDEFSELLAKSDKTEAEQQLLDICRHDIENPTVSSIPFSHLCASYQAALKNPDKTLKIIERTAHTGITVEQKQIILRELGFIDEWLNEWAPDDVKFELLQTISADEFGDEEKKYLGILADKIEQAPDDAEGEWFHKTVYEMKDSLGWEPKELFEVLYRALIGQQSGPRAGWFLSILPKEWLIKRLRLEA